MLPPSSGSKNTPSKKTGRKQVESRDTGGDMFLQRFGWLSTNRTALYPRTLDNHLCEYFKFYIYCLCYVIYLFSGLRSFMSITITYTCRYSQLCGCLWQVVGNLGQIFLLTVDDAICTTARVGTLGFTHTLASRALHQTYANTGKGGTVLAYPTSSS